MAEKIPFLKPNPAKLSQLLDQLAEIEASNIFSNYGPVNTRLEQSLTREFFGGRGACVSVCNATIGLMLAIRMAIGAASNKTRRYALMPSFTFAATAHSAIWAGLTPMLCDIEPDTWLASASAEKELLDRYGDKIAVIVPYAALGNNLDLSRYEQLSDDYGVPIVVDAAASLGSLDDDGNNFGTGFRHPIVFSMHVTKTFATSEAGLIYCANTSSIDTLRAMGNFGFDRPRTATMPGLNSKLSEVAALLALQKLQGFDQIVKSRLQRVKLYQEMLKGWVFQRRIGQSHAHQFVSALIPALYATRREHVFQQLASQGIGFGRYFDPHLADQPYFRDLCVFGELPETQNVASRIISLPLSDSMPEADIARVCHVLHDACS
ncbi:DegT/DnrJ/EryC1/StrS family aminotransferase [uncultured Bradyrhizobium sp.]|uniref:DegT/DnrJ/EryC1/StrS family aminotransferase n=1 Tax=uncultured Bradyrhizobium sp. TaxID=199684 RepID=UPI0035CA9094